MLYSCFLRSLQTFRALDFIGKRKEKALSYSLRLFSKQWPNHVQRIYLCIASMRTNTCSACTIYLQMVMLYVSVVMMHSPKNYNWWEREICGQVTVLGRI